jgi:hypothetical protein
VKKVHLLGDHADRVGQGNQRDITQVVPLP